MPGYTVNNKTNVAHANKQNNERSFFGPLIQPKLTINQPNDIYEQEADAMADKVMRMTGKDAVQMKFFTPSISTIQRKCTHCEEEEKKMQRKVMNEEETKSDEGLDHYVGNLSNRGQALSNETRDFYQSRLGYDFSNVKVHTDTVAAKSAQSINALAYTSGNHIVFNSGQYSPETDSGKKLLAHELTHVVQQDNGMSTTAGQSLYRKVGSVNCPASVFGAPADPKTALEAVDPHVVEIANNAADALATDAKDVKTGIPATPSASFQAYQNRFGLPNAVSKSFMNRLTGQLRPSIEIAASEELAILSKRYRMVARLFSQTISYRCPGAAAIKLHDCDVTTCGSDFAISCEGGSTIALCQPFWDQLTSDEAKAEALIHEAMHVIFGPTGFNLQGEIGDATQQGAGRNFNIAGCYEAFVNDLTGVDSLPVCPAPP